MDLCLGSHAGGGEQEALHAPVQVVRLVTLAQRQGLAKRRLVDLNDRDTGGFQIDHLVTQRERQGSARMLDRFVVAHERPFEHGDRPGQHAFDRAIAAALSVARPTHGHRLFALDVAKQDRRFDAARAVALYPALGRDQHALQQLAEILDHVVALGLAMHQHVESQLFLPQQRCVDDATQLLFVVGARDFAGFVASAQLTQLTRLWERADRRSRQRRQAKPSSLSLASRRRRQAALEIALTQVLEPRPDRWIVQADRVAARLDDRLAGGQRVRNGGPTSAEAARHDRQLTELLAREAEPRSNLGVEPALALHVDRHV